MNIDNTVMLSFSKGYVQTIEMVVRFSQEDRIRRLQFDFEDKLKEVFSTKSKALDDVPAPPGFSEPLRWAIMDGDKMIVASDRSINLSLKFGSSQPKYGPLRVAERYARVVDSAVAALLPPEKVQFCGLVVTIQYPTKDEDAKVQAYLADALLKYKPNYPIISSTVSFGYTGLPNYIGINFHFTLNGYRNINLILKNSEAPVQTLFDLESSPSTENGLQIRVDVNDRITAVSGGTKTDGSTLLGLIEAASYACGKALDEILNTNLPGEPVL